MKNEIIRISRSAFESIKTKTDSNKTYLVELDGKKTTSSTEFFDFMSKAYNFSVADGSWGKNWAAFNDMMTDLSWINHENHIFAIYSFDKMLSDNATEKTTFLRAFNEHILPFWEQEVLQVVIDGKIKSFLVYIIED